MFANFFMKRPVFAIACALVMLMVGIISIPLLPVEQYPDISPVQINVTANYIGASAQVVEDTVTTVLERQINGVEGLKYITSTSSSDGTSNIIVTFDQGYDIDTAAADVQNRVLLAEPKLPEVVRQTGVSVTKQSSGIVLAMALYSEGDKYDDTFISNYADLYVLDRLRRIKGVGNIATFGNRRYAMRLWLDPTQLANRKLTTEDVINALHQQNLQLGIGSIGQPPAPNGQMYQIELQTQGRLKDADEFENMVIKAGTDGTLVKLKDVGRAELGAENYSSFARYSGHVAVGYQILQIPGSNALKIANAVKAEMARIAEDFPPGLQYEFPYDSSLFVEASRKEVVKTLLEAIVLVVIVIFIFLQDWRTTIIPAITIPVSLIGTFAFVKVFNFSLNSLTLFGLTLASGMVVDDAIVVVEDITRLIQEKGLSPRRAASQSMHELFGAVIATSLVLLAVFVPVGFFPGTTGQLYKQFALTIAFSIVLSTFNAITLTPALAALLLRKTQKPRGLPGWIFGAINWLLGWIQKGYQQILRLLINFKIVVLLLFVASLVWTGWLYLRVPTAFLPEEDQGYFINLMQGPDGTSLNYTREVAKQAEKELLKIPEIQGTFAMGGVGFSGNTPNRGLIFAPLKSWDVRKTAEQTASAIVNQARSGLSAIKDAAVFAVNPPTIQSLGSVGGFVFQLQDRGDRNNSDINNLVKISHDLIGKANQTPGLQGVFSTYTANAPQLLIEVDREKAEALQVPVRDIFSTLQTFIGSRYVNDFNAFGRTYRVYVQADQQFRSNPEDIGLLYVRSGRGEMISLSSLVKVTPTTGPQTINHYNLYRSIEINGAAAPGFSSGQAIEAMKNLAATVLPRNISYEWSGITLEELESGGQAPIIFGLGIFFVFLVLAAQYNNFIDPLIILLSVPLAVLGALLAQSWRGLYNDVYCQVGLVMLIGLASKNAILIVEFANQLREQGFSITKAAVKASGERLRPILMTAISTLLGIWPLAVATGAGSASRQSLGTAVFGGMFVATFLSLFVVPILYIVITQIRLLFAGVPKVRHQAGKLVKQSEVDVLP
ncbi:efflux RND transporter permease subunit [Trichormus variabilis]|uniref:Multidrug efflux RND transporter permease subunit n=1 Tax=Trichormus variabilis SAG 1403-4b TaxID=447716 RepID=A0A3S1A6T4_ANAVA|nr:efflux RND transporter permease subunit [Trichormus variabilis]MBD2629013.1 efflux RND transporter permease subunit [Trichormus variabilis FACHB-164]RUS94486.1 multidrug efflux RND transporter permease subunit [Trichormus variabilis SAG 1403-4b]